MFIHDHGTTFMFMLMRHDSVRMAHTTLTRGLHSRCVDTRPDQAAAGQACSTATAMFRASATLLCHTSCC